MKKIAILFSGTGSNFAHIANTMHNHELQITVALTNNPNAKGIEIAHRYAIPLEIVDSKLFETREAFDQAVVERLSHYEVTLVVLAGFMRILTSVFTEQLKAINLHPSLLPRHKGLHAIERSYDDSHLEGGVSVHWVNSELDGGEIILQKEILKETLTFEAYDQEIRRIEKIALEEGIRKVIHF